MISNKMKGLKLIFFLTWKMLLTDSFVSAFISRSPYVCSALPFSPNNRMECSEQTGALILQVGGDQMTLQEPSTAGSDMTRISAGTVPPLEQQRNVGNTLFLIPSKGEADTQKAKFGARSPVGNPTIKEAVEHLVQKIDWFSNGLVSAKFITPEEISRSVAIQNDVITNVNCLIAFQLTSPSDIATASELFQKRRSDINYSVHDYPMSQFAIECATEEGNMNLSTSIGKNDASNPSLVSSLFPWTTAASHRRLQVKMASLFERRDSDDFVLALMLYFDLCTPRGVNIPWVQHSIDVTWEKGIVRNAKEIFAMVSKCGPCILKCILDPQSRKALNALTALDTRDQVNSYKTIVSYESENLRDFSLCILQKNNIFGCHASIPEKPYVPPIKQWRGKDLTNADARAILIGHLDENLDTPQISWKVAAGANEAYDKFPSQNQLFYTGSNGKDMWYDPVFRVNTLDGRHIWCKRHYRVRDGPEPGTFRLSVLDNGVTSNEFWTIVGAADDLSWVVFSYAGAAAAVGQMYLGGLICTPDGSLPPPDKLEKVWEVLKKTSMAPWEMFPVKNDEASDAADAGPPPLNFYRADIVKARKEKGLM